MPDSTGKKDTVKARMLVNLLGIPALLVIIWLGGVAYAVFVSALVILGLREYLALLPKGELPPRPLPAYLAAAALLAAFARHAGLWGDSQQWDALGLTFFAIVFVLLLALQSVEVVRPSAAPWTTLSTNLVGVLWLAGFGGSFILVRSVDFSSFGLPISVAYRLTLALYVSVWVCDSAAYLMGRRFGKRKLFPQASPNKTVVGSVSGLVAATVLMLLLGLFGWLPGTIFPPTYLLALGVIIIGGFGQLGDFVESRFKRDFGVKDSGRLLPGHGGVLDRFDSLLYVMPVTYLFLELIVLS